jgi:hypothetical protein
MRPALDSRTNVQRTHSLSDVFEVSKLLTFASFKSATISVWRGTPTAAALTRIDGYIGTFLKRNSKFGSVIVMESADFSAPDHAARAEHGRLTKKYEQVTFGVAMIVDGNTAKHSVYRFVMTTLQLLSSPAVAQKMFQSPASAASWLVSNDRELEKVELTNAIMQARSLIA